MYAALCEPWPLPPGCDTLTSSVPTTGAALVTGAAVEAASEVLWERTGHQFGTCSQVLRPCRRDCWESTWQTPWWNGIGWPSTWSSYASADYALWWAADCGRCSGGCSCNEADTLVIPDPVQSITNVTVDGVTLLPLESWVLYDNKLLVRTDGERWPMCQDWTIPVTGVGAWSITASFGLPVPTSGQFAVAELAREFVAWCNGEECAIPYNASSVTRQGVSWSMPSVTDEDLLGMPMVTMFLNTFNPHGLRDRARAWNPDDFGHNWRQYTP